MATTSVLIPSGVFDLRQRDVEPVLVRVERALGTQLDRGATVVTAQAAASVSRNR